MARIDKINYYLNMAETAAGRSTCLSKYWGCIIVRDDSIISTGYNGSPRKVKSCDQKGECIRRKLNVPRGTRYELCPSVHAEQNALLLAGKDKSMGATMYLVGIEAESGNYVENGNPCSLCKKFIINMGIEKVIVRKNKTEYIILDPNDWIVDERVLLGENGY